MQLPELLMSRKRFGPRNKLLNVPDRKKQMIAIRAIENILLNANVLHWKD